jgi:hypothetical protein
MVWLFLEGIHLFFITLVIFVHDELLGVIKIGIAGTVFNQQINDILIAVTGSPEERVPAFFLVTDVGSHAVVFLCPC